MDISQLIGLQIDEYHLLSLIGEGGMSAVYRAKHEGLDRDVAVKILSAKFAQEQDYVDRFNREARIAASLEHPHIVPVYDYGTFEAGAYLVMRLMRGGSLADRLSENTSIEAEDTLSILDALAEALDYAHERGVIHRDVKPGNILFDERGVAYLGDFGIAKIADLSVTRESVVLGTPYYMPPEQWHNQNITPAVDQYALAVIMYSLLTGQRPFEAPEANQVMYQHINEQPVLPHHLNPQLSPDVSSVILRGMAKQPEERYGSVGEFATALKSALSQPVPEPAAPTRETMPRAEPTVARPISPVPAEAPLPPSPPRSLSDTQPRMTYDRGASNVVRPLMIGGALGLLLICGLGMVSLFALSSLFTADATATPELATATDVAFESSPASTVTVLAITDIPAIPTPSIATPISGEFGDPQTLFSNPEIPVRDVVISADGQRIASAHGDGAIRVWQNGADNPPIQLNGHAGTVNTLDFSADGRWLVSGGDDQTVRLWDLSAGVQSAVWSGHSGPVRDISFSPDGTRVASASEDGSAILWDAGSGTPLSTLGTMSDSPPRILAVAFSPDGTRIATGSDDSAVRLWDTASGSLLNTFTGHREAVRCLAFSPDGVLLASGSTDDTVLIWRLGSGQIVHTLAGHGRDVWSVVFSLDSGLLASGGRDNNLRVWDVVSGNQMAVMAHGGWVLGVEFAADSLVSASGDGAVRLWRW